MARVRTLLPPYFLAAFAPRTWQQKHGQSQDALASVLLGSLRTENLSIETRLELGRSSLRTSQQPSLQEPGNRNMARVRTLFPPYFLAAFAPRTCQQKHGQSQDALASVLLGSLRSENLSIETRLELGRSCLRTSWQPSLQEPGNRNTARVRTLLPPYFLAAFAPRTCQQKHGQSQDTLASVLLGSLRSENLSIETRLELGRSCRRTSWQPSHREPGNRNMARVRTLLPPYFLAAFAPRTWQQKHGQSQDALASVLLGSLCSKNLSIDRNTARVRTLLPPYFLAAFAPRTCQQKHGQSQDALASVLLGSLRSENLAIETRLELGRSCLRTSWQPSLREPGNRNTARVRTLLPPYFLAAFAPRTWQQKHGQSQDALASVLLGSLRTENLSIETRLELGRSCLHTSWQPSHREPGNRNTARVRTLLPPYFLAAFAPRTCQQKHGQSQDALASVLLGSLRTENLAIETRLELGRSCLHTSWQPSHREPVNRNTARVRTLFPPYFLAAFAPRTCQQKHGQSQDALAAVLLGSLRSKNLAIETRLELGRSCLRTSWQPSLQEPGNRNTARVRTLLPPYFLAAFAPRTWQQKHGQSQDALASVLLGSLRSKNLAIETWLELGRSCLRTSWQPSHREPVNRNTARVRTLFPPYFLAAFAPRTWQQKHGQSQDTLPSVFLSSLRTENLSIETRLELGRSCLRTSWQPSLREPVNRNTARVRTLLPPYFLAAFAPRTWQQKHGQSQDALASVLLGSLRTENLSIETRLELGHSCLRTSWQPSLREPVNRNTARVRTLLPPYFLAAFAPRTWQQKHGQSQDALASVLLGSLRSKNLAIETRLELGRSCLRTSWQPLLQEPVNRNTARVRTLLPPYFLAAFAPRTCQQKHGQSQDALASVLLGSLRSENLAIETRLELGRSCLRTSWQPSLREPGNRNTARVRTLFPPYFLAAFAPRTWQQKHGQSQDALASVLLGSLRTENLSIETRLELGRSCLHTSWQPSHREPGNRNTARVRTLLPPYFLAAFAPRTCQQKHGQSQDALASVLLGSLRTENLAIETRLELGRSCLHTSWQPSHREPGNRNTARVRTLLPPYFLAAFAPRTCQQKHGQSQDALASVLLGSLRTENLSIETRLELGRSCLRTSWQPLLQEPVNRNTARVRTLFPPYFLAAFAPRTCQQKHGQSQDVLPSVLLGSLRSENLSIETHKTCRKQEFGNATFLYFNHTDLSSEQLKLRLMKRFKCQVFRVALSYIGNISMKWRFSTNLCQMDEKSFCWLLPFLCQKFTKLEP